MIAHRCARSATAAVRQQRDVCSGLKIIDLRVRREQTELDEMISAAARAELRPRPVLVLFRHPADRPIRVHHLVLAAVLEVCAHAEARLRLDGTCEPVLLPFQVAHRNVQHRHLHAAGDVHADGVRNHRVFRRQHAADGQAIANVRIRHQRARHRHRQQTRLLHLHHRVVFEPFAPLAILHRFSARRRRGLEQRFRKLAAQRVVHERRRIGNNGLHLLVQPRFVAAAEDELGNKIRPAPRGFTQRHAESEKILCVHFRQS